MQASSSHDQQIMARYVREIDRNMQWLVERAKVFDGMQTEVLDRLQPFLQGNMKRKTLLIHGIRIGGSDHVLSPTF